MPSLEPRGIRSFGPILDNLPPRRTSRYAISFSPITPPCLSPHVSLCLALPLLPAPRNPLFICLTSLRMVFPLLPLPPPKKRRPSRAFFRQHHFCSSSYNLLHPFPRCFLIFSYSAPNTLCFDDPIPSGTLGFGFLSGGRCSDHVGSRSHSHRAKFVLPRVFLESLFAQTIIWFTPFLLELKRVKRDPFLDCRSPRIHSSPFIGLASRVNPGEISCTTEFPPAGKVAGSELNSPPTRRPGKKWI